MNSTQHTFYDGPFQIKMNSPYERVLEFQTFFNISQHGIPAFFSISNTLFTYNFQNFKRNITDSRLLPYKIMEFQILLLLFVEKVRISRGVSRRSPTRGPSMSLILAPWSRVEECRPHPPPSIWHP